MRFSFRLWHSWVISCYFSLSCFPWSCDCSRPLRLWIQGNPIAWRRLFCETDPANCPQLFCPIYMKNSVDIMQNVFSSKFTFYSLSLFYAYCNFRLTSELVLLNKTIFIYWMCNIKKKKIKNLPWSQLRAALRH